MKKLKIFSLAALGLMAAACSNDESASGQQQEAKYITIEASIGAMTRATTTGNSAVFDEGDQVTLYAWTGSATAVPASKVVDGVTNTLGTDGKWTPASQMLWSDMVTPHYFLSIYPARTVTDFTADAYTLDATDYEKSDLLVAIQTSGLKATDNPVSLTFDHAMAKLNVNMNFRNQWDTTPTITSCVATAANTCTVNYLAKTVTAGEQAEISLPAAAAAATGYAATYSSIMVPQTGFKTVVITIDGKQYSYTHTEDIPLVAGKYTTLNLIVGRNKIEIGEVSINDWTEGTTIDGGQATEGSAPVPAATGHALSDSEVGEIVCSDGLAYAAADKENLPSGVTAVAMITYVGSDNGEAAPCNHGLALALSDEDTMNWEAAKTACSTKNTYTPVMGATWLLASKDQWTKMIDACTNVLGTHNDYQDLRDGFDGITGASNLQSGYYWSSTEYDSSNAWFYSFGYGFWRFANKDYGNSVRVRACLAF